MGYKGLQNDRKSNDSHVLSEPCGMWDIKKSIAEDEIAERMKEATGKGGVKENQIPFK